MKKYEELIKMSDKDLDAIAVPFEVDQAKLDMKKSILDSKKRISDLKAGINKAKSARPLSVESIVDAIDSLELAERVLRQKEELETELF